MDDKRPESKDSNALIPIVLAILVVGAIAWVFFINPAEKEQIVTTPKPTPTPVITRTPVQSPISTPTPEITPSGKQFLVKLESKRGFTPHTQTIKPGDKIVWENDGTYEFTLVSSDGLFGEKILKNLQRTNYTFMKTGTFSFYLKEEKYLNGTIIVEP
ncbi:MAG: hypothetical protein D4R88_09900 [Methanosarcinales archaeon]|nr:MAG: hypothetical protein D4R88_09900 [Methanosarcinales archaeon]